MLVKGTAAVANGDIGNSFPKSWKYLLPNSPNICNQLQNQWKALCLNWIFIYMYLSKEPNRQIQFLYSKKPSLISRSPTKINGMSLLLVSWLKSSYVWKFCFLRHPAIYHSYSSTAAQLYRLSEWRIGIVKSVWTKCNWKSWRTMPDVQRGHAKT